MASKRVIIKDATKLYGNFKACDNLNMCIEQGEFFTLLGPSGCGKTTLLRMIAGFNKIDGGEIYFDDKCINSVPAEKRNIGMVFQSYAIFPHMSVLKNVEYGLKARKIKGEEAKRRALEAMKMMQIDNLADRMPGQLSGGQQQRVALARAIVIEPDVLLMDEPLSNLDAKLRISMRTSIKKLQKQLNITTIYVTHDQEEALSISDRIAVLHDGKVEQIGAPKDIYDNPANQFVANFLGSSYFFDGYANNGHVTILNKINQDLNIIPKYEGEVKIAVRPEQIKMIEEDTNKISGTIRTSTFLGNCMNYEVEIDNGQTIEVNEYGFNSSGIHAEGERVSIVFPMDRVQVFDKENQKSIMLR